MLHARPDYNRIQDPLNKIPFDEPVFLLRGQDRTAAALVQAWADVNDKSGGDAAMSEMARVHAAKMEQWPTKKLADLPDSETESQMLQVDERCFTPQELLCKVQVVMSHLLRPENSHGYRAKILAQIESVNPQLHEALLPFMRLDDEE